MNFDRLVGVGSAQRAVGKRCDLAVGERRSVFEAIGGIEAVWIDLGLQVCRGGGEVRRGEAVDRGRLRGSERLVHALGGGSGGVGGDEPVMIGGARREAGDRRGDVGRPGEIRTEAGSRGAGQVGAVGLVEAVFEVAADDVAAAERVDVAGEGYARIGDVGGRPRRDDRPHVAENGDLVGGRVRHIDGVGVAVDPEAGRAENLAAAERVHRITRRGFRVAVGAVAIDARRMIS